MELLRIRPRFDPLVASLDTFGFCLLISAHPSLVVARAVGAKPKRRIESERQIGFGDCSAGVT
jgi:hypothetical protein